MVYNWVTADVQVGARCSGGTMQNKPTTPLYQAGINQQPDTQEGFLAISPLVVTQTFILSLLTGVPVFTPSHIVSPQFLHLYISYQAGLCQDLSLLA